MDFVIIIPLALIVIIMPRVISQIIARQQLVIENMIWEEISKLEFEIPDQEIYDDRVVNYINQDGSKETIYMKNIRAKSGLSYVSESSTPTNRENYIQRVKMVEFADRISRWRFKNGFGPPK
ncbi:MAG: hypothetical protein WCF94_01890 [bacterium]